MNYDNDNMESTEENRRIDEEIHETFRSVAVRDSSLLPLVISEGPLQKIDRKVISEKFYNSFNFSKLPIKKGQEKLVLGVTSPNKGEGKTVAASNMAVSLATAYHQRTVVVDMNFSNPKLHVVFGGEIAPGMAEAMHQRKLNIVPTKINNLFLLSAGNVKEYKPGIKDTIVLREILHTLKEEFDCIIIDMGAVFPIENFPVHFINEIDGLLAVIDNSKTQKEHIKKMYKHLDERRIIGHIFNRFQS
jgi:Mrp family chromosome partitioning ATPase